MKVRASLRSPRKTSPSIVFRRVSRFCLGWLLWLSASSLASSAPDKTQPIVTVFAAVSLTNALQDIGAAFTKESGLPVRFTFGASSMLAKMIDAGVHDDVFVSADTGWMDYLRAHNAIKPTSERNLLGNELVLVAPVQSTIALRIKPHCGLRAALAGGRLAIADPDSVPAGRYAKAALVTLRVWNDVVDRLLPGEDVRAALMFVSRGEAPLGIVYRTDVLINDKVRIVDTFPADTHPPVVYRVALTATAASSAQAFLDYLSGPAAAAVFKNYGFTLAP